MQMNLERLAARQGVAYAQSRTCPHGGRRPAGETAHPQALDSALHRLIELDRQQTGDGARLPLGVLFRGDFLPAPVLHLTAREQYLVGLQRRISVEDQFAHAAVQDIDLKLMLDVKALRFQLLRAMDAREE